MAFVSAHQTRILTGSFAMSAYSAKVGKSSDMATIDRTSFTDEAVVKIPGIKSHSLTVDAMFDDSAATGSLYDTVAGYFSAGTLVPVSVAPQGFAISNPVWLADAYQVSAGIASAVADGVNMPIQFTASGPARLGQSLVDLAAVTATASTTAVDATAAAASANGGIAHLHCTAVAGTGGPTCDVIIEHSVNGSTSWATLATFAQVTTAVSGQSVTVAAGTTVRRYLRATYTIAGTNPSFTIAVAFARS